MTGLQTRPDAVWQLWYLQMVLVLDLGISGFRSLVFELVYCYPSP